MRFALLTGGNGFLGDYIYNHINNHYKVFTLSRSRGHFVFNLQNEVPIFNERFDLVVHASGKAHKIPKTEFEKQEFYNVNVVGTRNLLEGLAKSYLPKYFVFISSVSVYGREFGENINEDNILAATDPYGLSKIEAERLVENWCISNNVICTILRLPLIVGTNPPGNLGAMINGIKKGYYFNIAGGNAKKSMVLATDVAKFILKAAEKGGTYNLSDGYHPTFNELSKTITKNMGKSFVPNLPKMLALLLAKIGDLLGNKFPINSTKFLKITSSLTFDDTKARMAFGWNPSTVLDFFKNQQNAQ